MVAKLFNVGGEQYLGVQPNAHTTEIRKVNKDGSTTLLASKYHNKGYTSDSVIDTFSKCVYDSDGIATETLRFYDSSRPISKRVFCINSETGENILKGVLGKNGKKLLQIDVIDPKIFTNPEMLKGNTKYVLNKIIEHLSKAR